MKCFDLIEVIIILRKSNNNYDIDFEVLRSNWGYFTYTVNFHISPRHELYNFPMLILCPLDSFKNRRLSFKESFVCEVIFEYLSRFRPANFTKMLEAAKNLNHLISVVIFSIEILESTRRLLSCNSPCLKIHSHVTFPLQISNLSTI